MVKCGVLFEVRTGFLNNIYLDELRLQRAKTVTGTTSPKRICTYCEPPPQLPPHLGQTSAGVSVKNVEAE
jgi:hypothetical protein